MKINNNSITFVDCSVEHSRKTYFIIPDAFETFNDLEIVVSDEVSIDFLKLFHSNWHIYNFYSNFFSFGRNLPSEYINYFLKIIRQRSKAVEFISSNFYPTFIRERKLSSLTFAVRYVIYKYINLLFSLKRRFINQIENILIYLSNILKFILYEKRKNYFFEKYFQ